MLATGQSSLRNGLDPPLRSQFNILSSEEIAKNPLLPCLVYDAVYILRLIVRLPALINQMSLTKCRRSIVLRHLYLFIAYLDETREFWFTSTRPALAAPVLSSASTSTSTDATTIPHGVKRMEPRSGPSTANAINTGATSPAICSVPKKRRRTMSSEPVSKTSMPPPSSPPPPSLSSLTSSELSLGRLGLSVLLSS
ncbi:unnamed protein product [Hydatigera taeniaeformis]|uniref:MRG domain-containing protein n=1 Tax=Hydatigena taeniaeformis TaxID=6205 RepID=A0A0R3WT53_HYDTA|nr:unnamed protein product [Hydatigera taeniaeformis]